MPIQITSNLVPKGGAKWHVVEDTYIRGGLRVVANAAVRDAIYTDPTASITLKAGMLLVTADDGKIWQYVGTGSWVELKKTNNLTYIQETPSKDWLIPHNRNSFYFTYVIFDALGFQVYPNDVQIVDNNNLRITFLEEISGHVTITFN